MSGVAPYDLIATLAALPRLYRVGYLFNMLLAALVMGARHGETLSRAAALGAAAGVRWACVLCRVLSVAVERGHCPKTLADGDTGTSAMWRAGLAMSAGLLAAVMLAHFAASLILSLI